MTISYASNDPIAGFTEITYFRKFSSNIRIETPYIKSIKQLSRLQKWIERFQTTPPDWFIEHTR